MTDLAAACLVVTRGGRRLLDDVSLALGPGELVGIVGPNGAGKTTLLRCLCGLLAPDAGTVTVAGRLLRDLSGPERAGAIGYVPQRFEPAWDYTAREILDLGASRRPGAGPRLGAVGRLFELEPLLDRRWSRLSGGERARTLVGSVLVTEPPILVADEPGASLDIRHRIALLAQLREYARTRVVAVVLHDLDLAVRFCDRIVVLADGRVALDGARLEVARSPLLDAAFGTAFERIEVRGEGAFLPVIGAPPP